jgi:PAS domain S-box-containing protein/putative nucleotidyltransferase with HDIG domain
MIGTNLVKQDLLKELKELKQRVVELESTEEEYQRLKQLQQATFVVHSTLDSIKVFKLVTDEAIRLLGNTTAFIMTFNEENKCFEAKALSAQKQLLHIIDRILRSPIGKLSVPVELFSRSGIHQVLEGRTVYNERLDVVYPIIGKKMCYALERIAGTRNYIFVPLQVDNKVAGILFVTNSQEDISEAYLKIIQDYANIASQAISNAALHNKTKLAEQALQKSESSLKIVLENAPDGIYFSDIEGEFLYGNRKAEQIIGYSKEELIGKNYLNLGIVSPEYNERIIQSLSLTATGRPAGPIEIELIKKDKSRAWVEINATTTQQQEKTVVVGFVRDITGRKLAEAALRASEVKFKELFDNTFSCVAVYEAVENGQNFVIKDFNKAAENIEKLNRSEIIGRQVTEVFPGVKEFGLFNVFQRVYRTGKPEHHPVLLYKDDRIFGWRENYVYRLPTGDIVATYDDVTEQKNLELEKEKNARFLQVLLDSIPIPIYYKDINGNYLGCNSKYEQFLGIDRKQIIGKNAYAITPRELADIYREKDLALFNKPGIQTYEAQAVDQSGNVHTVIFHKATFLNDNGSVDGLIGAIMDITERKQAETATEQSCEKLQQTLNGVTQAIATTLEQRDPYTAGHQLRVAKLARAIAEELGLSKDITDQIYTAGLIHDIGKVSIPAEILSKPGKLNEIEFALIKMHPQAGYNILKSIDFSYPLAQWVLEHHEMMNGSGYPSGLIGEKISKEARILVVADVVEAMSSHRPYRSSPGIKVALEEISLNKNILYDGDAVEACLRLFDKNRFNYD